MAKRQEKTAKERALERINSLVGAGREVPIETVDFSNPLRPKTCLEIDFPIIPINQVAVIEGNAGKPIYQMSKWWARRRSSVFRSMLLSSVMKAPEDKSKAAKVVWESYYANHQKLGKLSHLKVVEPFMGGGTTIIEGARLGMRMVGCDLNPVAWFVVKTETTSVNIADVKRLFADVEAAVKPLIMPYFACDGPDGEKGKWFRVSGTKSRKEVLIQSDFLDSKESSAPKTEVTWEELPTGFNIFEVPWNKRRDYRYEGPEIIYSFWGKHIPCMREGCGHRTPIMRTPVVATKTLTVEAWSDHACMGCGQKYDVERFSARMAPDVPLFTAKTENPFSVMDGKGQYQCPHCGQMNQDERAKFQNNSPDLGKAKNKKVELTLLLHPQWMKGSSKIDGNGKEFGGTATDSPDATNLWNNARAKSLRFLEVRGVLPEQVTCPETKVSFFTDIRGGTVPKKSTVACAADGSPNDVLEAIKASGKTGPISPYLIQGFSQRRAAAGEPYGGRFFASATDTRRANVAAAEWEARKDSDLKGWWPESELPYGFMTHHLQGGVPNHGFTHWWKMFTPMQLLIHSQLLKAIVENSTAEAPVKEAVLSAFQQYLRNQNLFAFWNLQGDKMEPMFSNNNFHPKSTMTDNSVFSPIGRGNWTSCAEGVVEGLEWAQAPWEPVSPSELERLDPQLAKEMAGKGAKAFPGDALTGSPVLSCGSASEMTGIGDGTIDVAITDPPFGGLLHYSELSDFFYVWLRLVLRKHYPQNFTSEYVPKAQEAVANKARQGEGADEFYQRVLTDCWRETYRVLKPGGILAFTFHHSEDEPWVGVLQSLFDAGFCLEATYPIRSDETKGDGEFGSKTIEYDIIHVCRKRSAEPEPISWARLRRQIMDDVRSIKSLLSQHQAAGLPAADIKVIKRGKALEYFSRHYGKVYLEQGRNFTIREALVGINLLIDDDTGASGGTEAPPANAEPYTRQFFRLFYETVQVPRDQMQKFLRGTGISPSDFVDRGWCSESGKSFELTSPLELAKAWKGTSRKGMARDFDQTMFLVGACFEGSDIRATDTLDSPHFAPHPATAENIDWLARHGGSQEIKFAAQRARTIYKSWLAKNKAKVEEQLRLFDLGTSPE